MHRGYGMQKNKLGHTVSTQKTIIQAASALKIGFFLHCRTLVFNSCDSPIQPQHELELDLIMGRNPPPHPTATFKALPGDLVS